MVYPDNSTGQMWFAGVDLTAYPYYARLTRATKYQLMDGYTSTQFTTGINSLGISRAYPKEWVLPFVLQSIAPDGSRETLMESIEALNVLFDPTNGPQTLRIAEFPGSYWLAQNMTSKLDKEDSSPLMFEADISFGCTGPPYSTTLQMTWDPIAATPSTTYTYTSDGDTEASPNWSFMPLEFFDGTLTIANLTSGEAVAWTGTLDFGDYLTFVLDENTGTPYTLLQNGGDAVSGASGFSWPHLLPGENTIVVQQAGVPIDGMFGVSWRDRFKMGLATEQTGVTPENIIPTLLLLNGEPSIIRGDYSFDGKLTDNFMNPMPEATVQLYSSTNTSAWTLVQTATTDVDGGYAFTPVTIDDGIEYFQVRYAGTTEYEASTSNTIKTQGVITQVGTFTTSTIYGLQRITGLGFQPKAVFIWGTATATYSWSESTNEQICYGFATAPDEQACTSTASNGGVTPTACSRRFADAAISLVQYDGTLLCEATLASMDPDGFTLNWTTPFVAGFVFHYIAIGGTSINAKVVTWASMTTTGNQVVKVGFEPNVVMHIGDARGGYGTISSGLYMMGAMDSLGNQWSKWGYNVNDVSPSSNTRMQLTDSCLVACAEYETTPIYKAHYVAMTSNGFEIDWSVNNGAQFTFASLCIGGGSNCVGAFETGGGQAVWFDSVSTPNIAPAGVFLTTDSAVASSSCETGWNIMMGASDGPNHQFVGVTDENGANPTVVHKCQHPDLSLVVANNNAGTYDSEGLIASLGACSISLEVQGGELEGVCYDGTYYYTIARFGTITKYDSSWNQVAINSNEFSDANAAGAGGLDTGTTGDIYEGKLYVACERAAYPTPSPPAIQRIVVYNCSDLSFYRWFDISEAFYGVSGTDCDGLGIDPVAGLVYINSFSDSESIRVYDLNDLTGATGSGVLNCIGTIWPDGNWSDSTVYGTPVVDKQCMQDVKCYNGNLYIPWLLYPTYTHDGVVTQMTPDGTNLVNVVSPISTTEVNMEIKGCYVDANGMHVLIWYADLQHSLVYTFKWGEGFTAWWDVNNPAVGTQLCYVVFGGSTT